VSNLYRKKKFHDPTYPYPVLVMEALLGDSLLYRMIMQRDLSEQYLVPLFRNFIQVVDSFHRRNLIHRDLKLDNIMLVSAEADSEVKLVDFGMMVRVPGVAEGATEGRRAQDESKGELGETGERDGGGAAVYYDRYLTGTPGYYAPESILHHEYSCQSDVWQCGVILYTILAGHLPFGSDNLKQITNAKRNFLSSQLQHSSPNSLSISPMALDLITRMLTPDPSQRITVGEVLKHPWLNSEASSLAFGSSYFKKIKNLACYETLRRAFHENNVGKETKSIRDGMSHVSFRVDSIETQLLELKKKVIKNLFHFPAATGAGSAGDTTGTGTAVGARNSSPPPLPPAPAPPAHRPSSGPVDGSDGDGEARDEKTEDVHPFSELDLTSPPKPPHSLSTPLSAPPIAFPDFTAEAQSGNMNSVISQLENASIDYETFSRLATESQLDVLTIPELFSLFDIDHNGSIDLREFLLTILTLRSPQENLLPNSSSNGASSNAQDNIVGGDSPLPKPPAADSKEPDPAKLYFDLFDLDGSGSLSRNEFLWMLSCLYHDGGLEMNRAPSSPSTATTTPTTEVVTPPPAAAEGSALHHDTVASGGRPSSNASRRGSEANPMSNRTIEELFQTLDVNQDNQIDYEEFRRFYQLMSVLSHQPSFASAGSSATAPPFSAAAAAAALEIPSHPKYNFLKQALVTSSFTFSSTGSSHLFSTGRSGVIPSLLDEGHGQDQGQGQGQGQPEEEDQGQDQGQGRCLIT
jgi:serine/threonine protein kinase